MDVVYECGLNFTELLDKKYHFVFTTKKRKQIELYLDFTNTDFRHILGFQYIDDIVIEQDPKKCWMQLLKSK